MGTTNARVLPEPVHASTATSLFPANNGMVASCTGVAFLKPCASSTSLVACESSVKALNGFPAIVDRYVLAC